MDQYSDTPKLCEQIIDLNDILTSAFNSRCSQNLHSGLTFPHRRIDFDPLIDFGGIRKD